MCNIGWRAVHHEARIRQPEIMWVRSSVREHSRLSVIAHSRAGILFLTEVMYVYKTELAVCKGQKGIVRET